MNLSLAVHKAVTILSYTRYVSSWCAVHLISWHCANSESMCILFSSWLYIYRHPSLYTRRSWKWNTVSLLWYGSRQCSVHIALGCGPRDYQCRAVVFIYQGAQIVTKHEMVDSWPCVTRLTLMCVCNIRRQGMPWTTFQMMGIKETFKGIYLRWGHWHIIIPISNQQYIWSVGLMYNLWYRI